MGRPKNEWYRGAEYLAGPAAAELPAIAREDVLNPNWAPQWAAEQLGGGQAQAQPSEAHSGQGQVQLSAGSSCGAGAPISPAQPAWAQAAVARENETQECTQVLLSCARSRGATALMASGWRASSWPQQAGGMMISSWHSAQKRLRTQEQLQQLKKPEERPPD